jgi:hypothetical protein
MTRSIINSGEDADDAAARSLLILRKNDNKQKRKIRKCEHPHCDNRARGDDVQPMVHNAPILAVSRQLGKVVYAHPTVRDAPMKAVIIQ